MTSSRDREETECLLPVNAILGNDVNKPRQSVLVRVCLPILVLQMCIWVALATVTSSLPIYLRKYLGFDSVRATEIGSTLHSMINLMPIFGAYVASRSLGRFRTISSACVVFALGMLLCTIATHPSVASLPLLVLGLFGGIAIACGGTGPNVVVFGADQFNPAIPSQCEERDSFFNWYYWAISSGSFMSLLVLSNVAANGVPPYISHEFGFFTAFAVATVAILIGSVVFYRGKPRYRIAPPPQGNTPNEAFAVVLQAAMRSWRGMVVLSGGIALIPGIVLTLISYFVLESPWHMTLALTGAACIVFGLTVFIVAGKSSDWVDHALCVNGGSFSEAPVRDVHQVLRLMPFFSIIVLFWAAFAQMTNFLLQGCQMDLRTASAGETIASPSVLLSAAMLTMTEAVTVLAFIPIVDRFVYPVMNALGCRPTKLRKIGAGLVCSFLSMAVAAWLEVQRKRMAHVRGATSNCASGSEALPMSAVSVWWQTPQYALLGLSEMLTSMTSNDLFYSEAPASMRSSCQAAKLLAAMLGNIIAGGLNSIFSFWVTSDLNEGHLENIFVLMAGVALANLVAFVHFARSFEYRSPTEPRSLAVTGFSPALARAFRAIFGHARSAPTQVQSARAG